MMEKSERKRGGHLWNPKGELNPAYKGGLIADKNWVYERYVTDQLSIREVAKLAGCSLRTASRWINTHGIKTRSSREGQEIKDWAWVKGENSNMWNGGKPLCECGNEKSRSAKVCEKCHLDRLSEKTGDKNANYKGISDVMMCVRTRIKNKWRKMVYERDSYTCQVCGKISRIGMHAHHIERIGSVIERKIGDRDISSPEKRAELINELSMDNEILDVNNGITLCKECHIEIHKGKRKDIVYINKE